MCHLHNETANVWSHLIGFVGVLVVLVLTMLTLSPNSHDRMQLRLSPAATTVCPKSDLSPFIQNVSMCPAMELNATSVEHRVWNEIDDLLAMLNALPSAEQVVSYLHQQRDRLEHSLSDSQLVGLHQIDSHTFDAAKLSFHRWVTTVNEQFFELRNLIDEECGSHDHHVDLAECLASKITGTLDRWRLSASHDLLNLLHAIQNHDSDTTFVHLLNSALDDFHRRSWSSLLLPQPTTNSNFPPPLSDEADDDIDMPGFGSIVSLHFVPISPSDRPMDHPLSRWPLAFYLLTAAACLLFSTMFHLFLAVNRAVAITMQSLDFAGICLLIAVSGK